MLRQTLKGKNILSFQVKTNREILNKTNRYEKEVFLLAFWKHLFLKNKVIWAEIHQTVLL